MLCPLWKKRQNPLRRDSAAAESYIITSSLSYKQFPDLYQIGELLYLSKKAGRGAFFLSSFWLVIFLIASYYKAIYSNRLKKKLKNW